MKSLIKALIVKPKVKKVNLKPHVKTFNLKTKVKIIIAFCAITSANAFALGGTIGTSFYSNFKNKITGENSSLNVVFGGLNHQQGEFNLGLSVSASKNLSDQYGNYDLGNLSFSASHSINIQDELSFSSTYSSVLGTSEHARKNQNLLGTLGHSLGLPLSLGEKTSLSFSLSNRFNLFKYETDIFGNSNILHQHTLGMSLGHQLSSWLSAGISASATKSFTHNNVATDSYFISASLSAQWKKLNIGLGYEKFDQFLDPSGRNSNISLFDLDASMFNLSLSTSF